VLVDALEHVLVGPAEPGLLLVGTGCVEGQQLADCTCTHIGLWGPEFCRLGGGRLLLLLEG
jgi:hypothetical protein